MSEPRSNPTPAPEATAAFDSRPAVDAQATSAAPDDWAARSAGPMPDIPGYTLESVLGRGGMGVVCKARQIAANRWVAVKMILAGELAGDAERQRFRNEAESIARLNHPNIVQIYEVGEFRNLPYFSMEYCAGGSLAKQLNGNPLSAEAAARLVVRLADAVEYAHQAGVVHRDLKPANILLAGGEPAYQVDTRPYQSTRDQTGRPPVTGDTSARGAAVQADGPGSQGLVLMPKITDFGLAKHLDSGAGQTRSGQVMGTPSYMAPEQALGETKYVGPLADVYALGAILYECLTGRPPFRAATTLETLDLVRHRDPVPVRELAPAVPRDLETVCLKCLQKDPHRRYASADALGADLRRFLDHHPIVARPVGPLERLAKWVRRNKAVSVSIALAGLALVTGTVVSLRYAVIAGERRQFAEQKESLAKNRERDARAAEALAVQRESETKLALAAESNALAAERQALSEKDAALARETRTSYARAITLASLEYERNNVPAVRRLLADCPPELRGWEWYYLDRACRAASWEIQAHPPGRTRVRIEGDQLITSGVRNLVKVWDLATQAPVADLAGHDGQAFALASGPGPGLVVSGEFSVPGDNEGRVIVWDLAKRQSVAAITGSRRWGKSVYSLASSPDGQRVAVGGEAGKVFVWNVKGDGSVQQWDVEGRTVPAVAFTADGTRVLAAADKKLFVFAADTGTLQAVLGASAEGVEALAAGPNRRWVALGYTNGLIRVYDLESRAPVATLSGHMGMIVDLAFSPDGRWVASASADGSARVWEVTTGNQVFHLRGHAGPVTGVAFRADGYELVTAGADGTVRGWNLVLGNEPVALFQGSTVVALVGSPVGRRLAWANQNAPAVPSTAHVTVFDFERGEPVLNVPNLPRRVMGLAFSDDGQQLAIGLMNGEVLVFDLRETGPGQRFKTGAFAVSSLAFSPDGSTLACAGSLPRALLIDLASKKLRAQLEGHKGSNTAIAYRPGGVELATGGYDGTVRIWNAADGAPIRVLSEAEGPIHGIAFRPDGKTLAACGADGRIRLWNADTGQFLRSLEGHSGPVLQVLFTPDGSRLLSVGNDQSLRCWDPDHGEALLRLAGMLGTLDRITWIGGAEYLASGAGGRSVLVWQRDPFPVGQLMATEKQMLWHNDAWSSAMLDRNWFTMEYHLSWLIPRHGDRHPGLYDQRGRARLELGRLTEALSDFTTAIEKGYDDPRPHLHRADVQVVTRDYEQAAATLAEFAARYPDNVEGLYRRGMLAAFLTGPTGARSAQRALRQAAVAADTQEVKLLSLWLDAVVPDEMADSQTRLAEATKLAGLNSRQGFYRAVYALWLHRAGQSAEAVVEGQKAVDGEYPAGKTVAAAVVALAARKLGRNELARPIRDELETIRRRVFQTDPQEWIAQYDPEEWPTYLGFQLLVAEMDRLAESGASADPPPP